MTVVGLTRDTDFVNRLRRIVPSHRLRPSQGMLVEPRHPNRGGVGLAFDYLFRVVLARQLPFQHPHLRWEADWASVLLSATDDAIAYRKECTAGKSMSLSSRRDGLGLNRVLFCHRTLIEAKVAVAEFHATGELTEALIWALYKVGQLEVVVRSGKTDLLDPDTLAKPDQVAVGELRELITLASSRTLTPTQILHLSPILPAARLVGGASPDLLVDGWMCEIKAVADFSDARRWTDQLVLYAALCELGGVDLTKTDSWKAPQVTRESAFPTQMFGEKEVARLSSTGRQDWLPRVIGIAVYFARHGEWATVPLAQLVTEEQFEEVKNLLCALSIQSKNSEEIDRLRQSLLPVWARRSRSRSRSSVPGR